MKTFVVIFLVLAGSFAQAQIACKDLGKNSNKEQIAASLAQAGSSVQLIQNLSETASVDIRKLNQVQASVAKMIELHKVLNEDTLRLRKLLDYSAYKQNFIETFFKRRSILSEAKDENIDLTDYFQRMVEFAKIYSDTLSVLTEGQLNFAWENAKLAASLAQFETPSAGLLRFSALGHTSDYNPLQVTIGALFSSGIKLKLVSEKQIQDFEKTDLSSQDNAWYALQPENSAWQVIQTSADQAKDIFSANRVPKPETREYEGQVRRKYFVMDEQQQSAVALVVVNGQMTAYLTTSSNLAALTKQPNDAQVLLYQLNLGDAKEHIAGLSFDSKTATLVIDHADLILRKNYSEGLHVHDYVEVSPTVVGMNTVKRHFFNLWTGKAIKQ